MDNLQMEKLCKLIRYYILESTTKAGSEHLTSSLSSVELMTSLFFKYFRSDLDNPDNPENDRLIFSKGHAAPLLYSLYTAAGKVTEKELLTLRKFGSTLEGHPTMRFKYTESPTGSLGQGLSVGVGMALNGKYLDKLNYTTHVLLGDGEMAEGQVWEAVQSASFYKLNNLIGIVDVNRLGQTGQTMWGSDLKSLESKLQSFGWKTYVVNDGHNLEEVEKAFSYVLENLGEENFPYMILAKTVKGKGVSFLEDKEEWHGRALNSTEFKKAVQDLGTIEKLKASINSKHEIRNTKQIPNNNDSNYKKCCGGSECMQNPSTALRAGELTLRLRSGQANHQNDELISTRKAFGEALVDLGKCCEDVVVLDGDVGNSTYTELFKKEFPERFFEMYIAEQNMVSVAIGLAVRGKVPFVSTFSAFLTRAYDQIRMAHLAGVHIVFNGTHGGVSVGEDGPSQMGLEDLAMFRTLPNTTILYPSDGVSAWNLAGVACCQEGIVYLRTSRPDTPIIYESDEKFVVGGSKTLRSSKDDKVTIIAAGITVHEALKAYTILLKKGINARIIDCYSLKPIDKKTILEASKETKAIITAEDHYIVGGLGDAVMEVVNGKTAVYKLAIEEIPRSGSKEDLMRAYGIDGEGIVKEVVKR